MTSTAKYLELGSLGVLGLAVYSFATGNRSRAYLLGGAAVGVFLLGRHLAAGGASSAVATQIAPPPPPPPGAVTTGGPAPSYFQAHPDVLAKILQMTPAQQKVEFTEAAANTGPGHF